MKSRMMAKTSFHALFFADRATLSDSNRRAAAFNEYRLLYRPNAQQAEIQASGKAPPNDNESAIIVVRPATRTTAIVRGKNNGTG